MLFHFLLLLLVLLFFIEILLNYNARAREYKKIPGPKLVPFFGNTWALFLSPVEIMKLLATYTEQFKSIYRHWGFPIGMVNIYNPEDIEILLSNVKYNNKSIIYKMITPWLRNGLLLSRGEKWQKRRKLLTPAFHFNTLRRYYIVMQENSQRLVSRLDSAEQPVDVVSIVSEYTLHTICETAMGTQLNNASSGAKKYKEAIYELGKLMIYRLTRFYLIPEVTFNLSLTGLNTRKLLKIVHDFTEKVIAIRKQNINLMLDEDNNQDSTFMSKRKTAMLDLLLMAEKDGHIDKVGIQEEVDTFMFEGHDTTASGLTFCLMLLAKDKNIQNKIFIELEEIFGDSTRPTSIEDLSRMKYLECCIKEALRMYPPVYLISRYMREPVQMSGYTIPAKTTCNVHIMALHRNPDVYKDPLVFDPDRFLPENCMGRHPFAYIPFSAGPRNCIGQKFAMMEMKSAVSEILRKFQLQPITRHEDIEFTADLVLRHKGPVYVNFVRRQI